MPFCRRRFRRRAGAEDEEALDRVRPIAVPEERGTRAGYGGGCRNTDRAVSVLRRRDSRESFVGVYLPHVRLGVITMSKTSRISRATRIMGCRSPRRSGTFIRSVRSHRGR